MTWLVIFAVYLVLNGIMLLWFKGATYLKTPKLGRNKMRR